MLVSVSAVDHITLHEQQFSFPHRITFRMNTPSRREKKELCTISAKHKHKGRAKERERAFDRAAGVFVVNCNFVRTARTHTPHVMTTFALSVYE